MPTPQFDVMNVLRRAEDLDVAPAQLPYSGVEIVTGKQDANGNDIIYTAGDSSGRVLTINNPWGTQTQANNIITQIRGFTYQPYTAQDALVDPCAEIGDGVSVNGVYSGIYKMSRDYNALMPADIAAPQSEDIDHEYPFEPDENREITRRFTQMESELSIASSEISAKVSKKSPEGQTSFSWELSDSSWVVKRNGSVVFKVDANGAQIAGKVTASSGKIGGFDIGASAIYKDLSSLNSTTKGVFLGTGGIRINGNNGAYFRATSSGDIEGNNLKLSGTLTVGGSTITAGNLRSGAVGGNNWSGAKTGYGYADDIWAAHFHSSGDSYFAGVQTYVITHYGTKREYRPITITINGYSYSVWGVRL